MDLFDSRESYLHSMDAKFVGHIEIFNLSSDFVGNNWSLCLHVWLFRELL